MMETKNIWEILNQSPQFLEFCHNNPNYDVIIRYLTEQDMHRIDQEYAHLNLFPHPINKGCAVMFISKILGQNGYPKLKFYLDLELKIILHVFATS